MKVKFQDPGFSFQLLRLLGNASSRQADVGEALATANRIVDGDFESWAREWSRTAARLEAAADDCLAKGHKVSASDTYFRATNYYRAADFYLHGHSDDPRILELSGKSARCFDLALRNGEMPYERTLVPYEGTTLPGIFYPAGRERARTLVVHTGFDGTIDGLFPWARAATRRGWHCFTFEGPGQGQVIRRQGLPFRPDWEKVVGPAIDHLVARPEVDADRLALLGISMGGYLAPRAAAFEHRLKACVANGGVMSFMGPRLPKGVPHDKLVEFVKGDPDRFDAMMNARTDKSAEARWGLENGMYTFQAKTPAEFVRKALEYDLTPVASQIRCPTLIVDVESENSFPGEARKLYDALTCPKTWLYFTEEEGAGDHCQTGSPSLGQQRIMDWLDETVR